MAAIYITRCGIFGPFTLDSMGPFRRDCAPQQDLCHEPTARPTAAREIVWPSVITVISAAILIGAEVFGAAFAGGWALAILFGLDDTGAHILQAVLFAIGVLIMVAFIRAAQRIEPFTRARLTRAAQQSRAAQRAKCAYAHPSENLNVRSCSSSRARAENESVSTC